MKRLFLLLLFAIPAAAQTSTNIGTLNGGIIFADQYANVQAAINVCPVTSCIVMATSPMVNLALGTLDPGTIPVTLYLGAYTYTTAGITIRPNFKIYGLGTGAGTIIQSTSITAPVFSLQTGSVGTEGVHFEGFRVYCGAGNSTQVGLSIVAGAGGGGLWYSSFNDVFVGGDSTHNCGGNGILLDGSAGGSPPGINQFLKFTNVFAFRTQGGGPAFHVKGVAGQIKVDNSEFDGQSPRDLLPDVVIEDSTFAGFVAAYSIAFDEVTMQRAGIAVKLRGVTNFTCDNCHFEDVTGVVNLAQGINYGNWGNAIRNSYCATGCAEAAGTTSPASSGYLVTMDAVSQIAYDNNSVYSTPDNFYLGTLTYLEHQGLMNAFSGTQYTIPNSSMRIPVGIDCDSPGYKCAQVSIGGGGVAAGARISVNVPWVTAFADTNYVPICTVLDFVTGGTSAGLVYERINAQAVGSVHVTVFNASAGTLLGNVDCTAVHP